MIKKTFRSLLIHRLRTFLSTLGILFGVAAVIAMLSIGEGAKQETLEQIAQLGMKNILIRSVSESLTWKDIDLLNHIPFLLHTAPLKAIKGKGNEEILAVSRAYGEMKSLRLAEGRFICDLDTQEKGMVCILGYEVAKSLGKKGHVGMPLKIDDQIFDIVGVLHPIHWKPGKNGSLNIRNLDHAVLIPLGSEKALLANSAEAENLSEITLQLQNPLQMGMTVPLVKKILSKTHENGVQLVVPQELLKQAAQTQKTFNLVLGSIAAISLIVGGIGIMNIMLATVSERTREIGIRRALGANQKHILKQFLFEALLLTLTGAMMGILVGISLSLFINYFAGWNTIVTLWSLMISLLMSILVGLCSGIYPAYIAAKMDPIRALRNLD